MLSGEEGDPPVKIGMPFADLISPLFGADRNPVRVAGPRRDQVKGSSSTSRCSARVTSLVASEPFELLERFGIPGAHGQQHDPADAVRDLRDRGRRRRDLRDERARVRAALRGDGAARSCSTTSGSRRCRRGSRTTARSRPTSKRGRGRCRPPRRRPADARRRRGRAGARAEGGRPGRAGAAPRRDRPALASAPRRGRRDLRPGAADPILAAESRSASRRCSASTTTRSTATSPATRTSRSRSCGRRRHLGRRQPRASGGV